MMDFKNFILKAPVIDGKITIEECTFGWHSFWS